MGKLTDTQKDYGNDSFVNFVITKNDLYGFLDSTRSLFFLQSNAMYMHALFENKFFHWFYHLAHYRMSHPYGGGGIPTRLLARGWGIWIILGAE